MKTSLLVLMIAFSLKLYAQDTTYYNADWEEVQRFSNCFYYQTVERDKRNPQRVTERSYWKSGQIKTETSYRDYEAEELHGLSKTWNEEGQLLESINYKKGKMHGRLYTYWENGQLKRKDLYNRGDWVDGETWSIDGTAEAYYPYKVMPEFPGGLEGLTQYVLDSVDYPEEMSDLNVEGLVVVSFIVEKDGTVSGVKVVQRVAEPLDEEAIRVVKAMPKWTPGKKDGEPVRAKFTLPIRFKVD